MSPDPSGLALADPSNPQSFNLYSYVLNNPLSLIDPNGLECVWDDGSFDSADDAQTGSHSGCSSQGGTYVDPKAFGTLNAGDWSNQANSGIAAIASTLSGDNNFTNVTVSANGSGYIDQTYMNMAGNVPYMMTNDSSWSGDRSLALVTAVAKDTASVPNICSLSFSARAQIPGTPVKAGVSMDGNGKLSASASWSQAGGSGGPSISLTGRANASGGAVAQQVSVPIPFTPLNFTVGVNPLGGRNSYGVNRNVGKFVSVSAAATFGYMGDSTCGRH